MSNTTNTVEQASKLLAASYVLYLKTHNFHWNVKGPMFSTLHTLFMTQYTELALAVDEIAERIRALGHPAPGTFKDFYDLSTVKEVAGVPKATEMIQILASDQERIVEASKALFKAAEAAGDQASADLAVRRMDVHQKNAWMLSAHLD
ncbi:MAG TPA: DNA starvation/stationary phase protection protein [Planctomycetota bacterium]|jgi:starvation-inducible DNA-binding protein|nr:DNA starvation/stationary phase protection protein [Planctomycetota bacterium]